LHRGTASHRRDAGTTFEAFQAEWRAFIGGGEGLATWNHATLDLLCAAADLPRAGVALKGVYHNLKRHRGSLEDIVAQEALDDKSDPSPAGRAERRLRNAVRLANFLHQRGRGIGGGTGADAPPP
jgi:hypothetical protein